MYSQSTLLIERIQVLLESTPMGSRAYKRRAVDLGVCAKSGMMRQSRDSLAHRLSRTNLPQTVWDHSGWSAV
jgi:hypothetical protein